MNDKELLLSRVLDKANECEKNLMITNTGFLSIDERSYIQAFKRSTLNYVNMHFYGGYEDAERTIAVFVPSYYYEIDDNICAHFCNFSDDNPIAAVRRKKDRFSVLSHRDYLGSLMGLGIKREMIGDIIIGTDGAYVFCIKSIAGYICDNLNKIGRGTIICDIVDISDVKISDGRTEIKFHSVASLRLDNILAAGFNVGRSDCTEAIKKGLVFVNSESCIKPDINIKEGDKIVFRGKGKIVLDNIIGENKKGRIHINIKHFR